MKSNIVRWMTGIVMAGAILAGPLAWAGECCTTAASATKAGKTCAACQTKECCKAAATEAAKAEDAKPCAQCAAKAESKDKAST